MPPARSSRTSIRAPDPHAGPGEVDESISKPDPVPAQARAVIIHLGLPLPTASCGLPANVERAARSRRPFGPLDLAPGGVYLAARVTSRAGGLLHHRFTLTFGVNRKAVCFLWHCPAGHPGWALPTTLPCGVRTFLDSRERTAITRSTRPPRSLCARCARHHPPRPNAAGMAKGPRHSRGPSEVMTTPLDVPTLLLSRLDHFLTGHSRSLALKVIQDISG